MFLENLELVVCLKHSAIYREVFTPSPAVGKVQSELSGARSARFSDDNKSDH